MHARTMGFALLTLSLALVVGATLATVGMIRATRAEEVARQEAATADQVGDVRLLEADGRDVFIGGWNTLRQQQAGEVVESLRTAISPRYRRQVENYCRVLSERGQSEGGQQ